MVGIKLLIPTKLHLRILFDNFLAVVCSASSANSVREIVFAAFGALCHAGKVKLPNVGTSFVASCLRNFFLWYCHFTLPPLDFRCRAPTHVFSKNFIPLFQQCFQDRKSGINLMLLAGAFPFIQILTTLITKSAAILFTERF